MSASPLKINSAEKHSLNSNAEIQGEDELIKGAMEKFDQFWTDILKKYEKVTNSQMNPKVPDFEKLFKSLSKPEKRKFKPFLKILAHSLQFLDKMENLDTKLNNLKEELKASIESQSVDKIKMLENQILKLQKNCKNFISSEESMKKQLQFMQEKNKELDKDLDRAAKEILELKKEVVKVTNERSQLSNSLNELNMSNNIEVVREERDQLKSKVSELINEIQEKDNTIDEMVLKINELKETEMKYIDACDEKLHLQKQIEDKDNDIEVNKLSLENLQTALKEQQESFEWTINDIEKEKYELENTLKVMENDLQISQGKSEQVIDNSVIEKMEGLEKLNSQLSTDINQLVLQKEGLAKELEGIKDKMKSQELSKGNLVGGSYKIRIFI